MTLPFRTGFWGHCRHAGLDEVAEKSGSDGSCRRMSVFGVRELMGRERAWRKLGQDVQF